MARQARLSGRATLGVFGFPNRHIEAKRLAIARVCILDFDPYGTDRTGDATRRLLTVTMSQQFCWTRSYTISLVMGKSSFISMRRSLATPGTTECFRQGETGR